MQGPVYCARSDEKRQRKQSTRHCSALSPVNFDFDSKQQQSSRWRGMTLSVPSTLLANGYIKRGKDPGSCKTTVFNPIVEPNDMTCMRNEFGHTWTTEMRVGAQRLWTSNRKSFSILAGFCSEAARWMSESTG